MQTGEKEIYAGLTQRDKNLTLSNQVANNKEQSLEEAFIMKIIVIKSNCLVY